MRGLEQTKAIQTGIIFLSKIDKIIPDSIALKRCKQMVQKSEKTKCDVVCQIHKSCANQENQQKMAGGAIWCHFLETNLLRC